MKKILCFVIIVSMLLSVILSVYTFADANEVTIDGITYICAAKQAVIKKCDKSKQGDIIIPESIEYNGKQLPVKSIEDKAFENCSSIEKVVISDSVTHIGQDAFQYSGITNLDLGNGVREIDDGAFYGCGRLSIVIVGNSLAGIGRGAFGSCNINKVYISDISKWCEIGCDGNSTPLVSAKELYINGELVTDLIIPSNVTSVCNFYGFKGLKSVTISEGVTKIRYWAFYDCTELKSVVIPNSITEIESETFTNCKNLTSITIPDSVTKIGSAFSGCSNLKSIKLSNNISEIEGYTFSNCTNLESIIIPKNVTSIKYCAFEKCYSLEKAYYLGTEEDWKNVVVGNGNEFLTNSIIFHPTHIYDDDNDLICNECGYERDPHIKGDMNGDNAVDNKDVVVLFRYVSGGGKAEDESIYDYNKDGNVDNKDVVSLFRAVSGSDKTE